MQKAYMRMMLWQKGHGNGRTLYISETDQDFYKNDFCLSQIK